MITFLQHPSRGRRIVLGFILGILILSMVAFLGDYFTGVGGAAPAAAGVYATVGSERVTTQQVMNLGNRMAQQQFRGQAVPEMFQPYFRRQAANELIVQAAIAEEADRLGLKVSDEELRAELSQGVWGQQLFPGGKYIGKEKYEQFIQSNFTLKIADFEKLMKREMLIRKLQSVIAGGVTVPEAELQREFQRNNVKVRFDYAFFTAETLMKQVNANETDLRAYYEANKGVLTNQMPEQRKARYVVVDGSKATVSITEADYQRAYAQQQDRFRIGETADVRHILVKEEALAKDIKKQLDSGAKFEDLAKRFSEDTGSKDNGGLYQGVIRNQMVPEFDKATFTQPVGKVGDPVKTSFGFHIIKVDARNEARLRPLAEVKADLEAGIRAEKQVTQLESLANTVLAEAKSGGMDAAAAKHGLTVVNTDYFAQSTSLPGIGQAPNAMQELFAMRAKEHRKIALQNGMAVAELLEIRPPTTPSFEQARASLEQQFRNERAVKLLESKTKELADRARSLNNLKQAAKETGATVKSSDFVPPTASVAELGQMNGPAAVVFDMKPGQISDPISAGRTGAVANVLARQEPDPSEFAAKKEALRESLLENKRREVLSLFIERLTSRMRRDGAIRVNEQEQKQLLGGAQGS